MHCGNAMNAGISLEKRNTKIHFHVFLCILIFYALFYMTCTVCAGILSGFGSSVNRNSPHINFTPQTIQNNRIEDFDWMLPFRHTITPSLSSSQYLVHVISAEITFLLSGLLFVPVVGSMVWDYSATVTFVHVFVCYGVTQEFPLMWQWWLHIGSGLFLMITCGQTLAYLTCGSANQRHLSTI